MFAIVEVIVTSVQDGFPNWVKKKILCHELLVLSVCFISFVLGLPLVTQGGIYFFHLIDHYAVCKSIVYIAFFEVIAVSWFYGANRLSTNIERMSGEKTNMYFRFCWVVAAPLIIFLVWFCSLLDDTPLTEDHDTYHYPRWAEIMGWIITSLCLVSIPLLLVYVCIMAEGKNIFKKLCNSIKPRIDDIPPPVKESEVKELKNLLKPAKLRRSTSLDQIHITVKK